MCPIDWSALAVLILVCRIDDNLMEKYDFLNSYSSFYPNRGQVPLFKGRSFGVGNGNPPQYFCLENSMDRGAWGAIVPRCHQESNMTEHTHTHTHTHPFCNREKLLSLLYFT